ncbi:MAG: PfkB family carbohydrate kinase [Promethearchaeota archaeon]
MEKKHDLTIFGHMAMDTVIRIEGGERTTLKVSAGGAVTFGSIAARTIDPSLDVAIGTKVGKDINHEMLDIFRENGVDLSGLIVDECCNSTQFHLVYEGEERALTCPAMCSKLVFDEFPSEVFNTKRVQFGPLCREITIPFIESTGAVIEPGVPVGIDLQGFLRDIHEDGTMDFIDHVAGKRIVDKLYEIFGRDLIIKGDDVETRAISTQHDPRENVQFYLDEYPLATTLITSGRHGSILARNDGRAITRRIPAFEPRAIVDETGAGDTFLASFLTRMDSTAISFQALEEAALFASASSSFLVEGKGYKGMQPAAKIHERVKSARYFSC